MENLTNMPKTKLFRMIKFLTLSLFVSILLIMSDYSMIFSSQISQIPSQTIDSNFKCPEKTPVINEVNNNYPSFLFIGDSIMKFVGESTESKLKKSYNTKEIIVDFKISSGLNRIDFYDWYSRTPQVIECYKPDVIVIMFGGNDYQNIKDDQGKSFSVFKSEWKEVYRKRVEKYAQLVSDSSVKKVYWVGQPISNKYQYNKIFPLLNTIYEDVSKSYSKIKFVDTWKSFVVNGKFSLVVSDRSGKKGKVRVKDGVHITYHGSNILADLIIDKMLEDHMLTLSPLT